MIYTAIVNNFDKPRTDIKVFKAYNRFKDSVLNAKIYKVLSHKYINNEYSIWVDGNLFLKQNFIEYVKLMEGADIAVFENPYRDCLFDEIDQCIEQELDNKVLLEAQKGRYKAFPRHNGLGACFLIIRRHTEQIKRLNEQWWSEICSGSKRDQISFPYVFKDVVKYIPKVHPFDNKYFKRVGHNKNEV